MNKTSKTIAVMGILSILGLGTFASITPLSHASQATVSQANNDNLKRVVWSTMFNAIHNYSTIQGEMDYNLNNKLDIVFGIQEGNQPAGFEDAINKLDIDHIKRVSVNGVVRHIDFDKGTARDLKLSEKTLHPDTLPSNLSVPNDLSQPDPSFTGISHTLTDPFELLHALLDNFSNWNVIDQSKEFGRDTYEIAGSLDPNYGAKFGNATNFKMVVDKSTGVVFDVEYLDSNGVIKGYIKMKDVKFNLPLPKEKLDQTLPQGIKQSN